MEHVDVAPIDPNAPEFTRKRINLAQPRLGAEATFVTDDFFAPVSRMLNPDPAIFVHDKYDDNGKWMDGWESRRKRVEGHDWCVLRLGLPGIIKGIDMDTSHFTGNYAPAASIEACYSPDAEPGDDANWVEIVPAVNLNGNSHCYTEVSDTTAYTHLKVHIYPDGGLARLRVYGMPQVDWTGKAAEGLLDLAAMTNGGRPIACNDAHFGKPENLLAPGRGVNMGDGWETRRRREPGNDWAILALGAPGTVEKIIIDTAHFKGNFPDSFSLQAAHVTDGTDEALITRSMFWQELIAPQKLSADNIHEFTSGINDLGPVTHVRVNIFPDGGISRVRLMGKPA